MIHTFHIPVMGLGFTIDTPIKVAKYGITSTLSIMDDLIAEQMRAFHSKKEKISYEPISEKEEDFRAKRITAYLDLLNEIVSKQFSNIKDKIAEQTSEVEHYFDLLPDFSPLKEKYNQMKNFTGEKLQELAKNIQSLLPVGAIDVNIMTKVDKNNYDKNGEQLPSEYSDALAALRGYANSKLKNTSVILSAGLNPRLFSYFEKFDDFYPNKINELTKKVILKVSDFRSALIQGKMFAKKGIWVSEFRIESGLNCGGHAFATDGLLMGPILEEFKQKRTELSDELYTLCNKTLESSTRDTFNEKPSQKITVQGGIGNANEDKFLREYYNLDGTGWGSPFLLVPEATNLDNETTNQIINAKKSDYFLSDASPLGVPFNNLKNTSSEIQRINKIEKNKPGSACYKKFLSFNTEHTEKPICVSSRQYQNLKIKELNLIKDELNTEEYNQRFENITVKDCLCEGLSVTALLKNNVNPLHNIRAVTLCPGPNLAYFNKVISLNEMVKHIYGKINILRDNFRPHIFINELELYVEYLKNEYIKIPNPDAKKITYFTNFKSNLLKGIEYYQNLAESIIFETSEKLTEFHSNLNIFKNELIAIDLK